MRPGMAHLVPFILQQFPPFSLSDALVVQPCQLHDAVHTGRLPNKVCVYVCVCERERVLREGVGLK